MNISYILQLKLVIFFLVQQRDICSNFLFFHRQKNSNKSEISGKNKLYSLIVWQNEFNWNSLKCRIKDLSTLIVSFNCTIIMLTCFALFIWFFFELHDISMKMSFSEYKMFRDKIQDKTFLKWFFNKSLLQEFDIEKPMHIAICSGYFIWIMHALKYHEHTHKLW